METTESFSIHHFLVSRKTPALYGTKTHWIRRYRLAGTDGVSLETFKWSHVLQRMGHECFFMAGELESPQDHSMLVPSCHFQHPGVREVYEGCFDSTLRLPRVSRKCEELKNVLKQSLRDFGDLYKLDLIIPENAVTIPLNIPLALAITEYLNEIGTPCIAHHHDFYWERQRFQQNACSDYLASSFPPSMPTIQHVVINSSQVIQLSLRQGIAADIIPNVMDFAHPPISSDGYTQDLRQELGIPDDHKLILQPTRVVQRKGIEHAVELVHRLGLPASLVISHSCGDEGNDYAERIKDYSKIFDVNTIFCGDRLAPERGNTADGQKVYSLTDIYEAADLVTYPSTIEGFGNAFLEAVYHRKPILVNNYAIYESDIRPKGFHTVEMEHFITRDTIEQARAILTSPQLAQEIAESNYELAQKFFSFEVLEQRLSTLLLNCFGR